MKNNLGVKAAAAATAAAMLPVSGLMPVTRVFAAQTLTVRLNPSDASGFNGGAFEGWGTSMGWWGNRIGYSEALSEQAAKAFYSEEGLGLDIVRYNVGGGDDPTHNHITRSDSKLPCFAEPAYNEDGSFKTDENGDIVYSYNWDADYNQVNALKKIKAQNPNVHIEGYTNSPPWFMTVSGCSGGGVNAGDENLDPENYDIFAKFIADVTEHFNEAGLKFDSYSPMNEPNPATKYWTALNAKQEGNLVAQGEHQSGLINALSAEYDARGIDALVAGPDETSIDYTITSFNQLSDAAKANLDRIDTHTYGGSNRAGLKATAENAGKNLWMSEVDGGWNGFGLASRIILDLNGMKPSAWVMWDIVDSHRDSEFTSPTGEKTEADRTLDVTGTLWGVAMANHDTQTLELSNKYYAFGQFTKYINPGDTIIASSDTTLAAYNRNTGDIKIVVSNSGSADIPYTFDLTAFTNVGGSVKEIRSNNLTGDSAEHWKEIEGEAVLSDKKITSTAKAGTVTTYIVEGAPETAVDYAVINGGSDQLSIGSSAELELKTTLDASRGIAWSVSDSSVLSISSDGAKCSVEAISAGTASVTASVNGYTVSREFYVPLYTLTGTASWGNDSNRPADSADYTKAADGDLTTYFDGTANGFVRYDYGAPYKLSSVRLAARSGNGMPERTVGGAVQGSNDGIEWTDLYRITTALPSGAYTEIAPSELLDNHAYRYYRYTNSENMANIAEFILDGAFSDDVPENAPVIKDIAEFADNFESGENIFGAASGAMSDGGNVVFETGLDRYGSAFAPVRATAVSAMAEPVSLTDKDRFRLTFTMFAGWESGGKDNTFAIKDADGNEIAALYMTGGGYNFNQIRVGGENVLPSATIAQSRSNPGTSKAGANGWNASGQPYVNTVGYNKTVEIIIDGNGAVSVSATGGMEDTAVSGTLNTPVTIGSLELTGNYNSAAERTVSYDNFDGDIITYAEAITQPEVTPAPEPTDAPVIPQSGELISLDFDNADLSSGSGYGAAEGSPIFTEADGRKCIRLDGTSATAIKLTDANGNPLLTGQKNITVSFKIKPDSSSTSWWFYAAPDDSAQNYQNEKYLGAFTNGGTLNVERYRNSGARSEASAAAVATGEWNDVVISVEDAETVVYVNGARAAQTSSSVDISAMLGSSSVAYIGRANWGNSGEYASGYIDDFVIKTGIYENPLSKLDLGDLSDVRSDISLPAQIDGYAITWTSSDPSAIGADGTVTRADDTRAAELTASISADGTVYTRSFAASVTGLTAVINTFTAYAEGASVIFKSEYGESEAYDMYTALYDAEGRLIGAEKNAAEGSFDSLAEGEYSISGCLWDGMEPKAKYEKKLKLAAKEETDAYLFVHFMNTEGDASCEQIYFSVSEDGQSWTTLNDKKPVLTSGVGEKGVRDPYILRGEDGRFFIIATDLSIYNRRAASGSTDLWKNAGQKGSKSIVIWESEDLVSWSEARLVEINNSNAGCTWAPEAVYDPERDEYMVFWASTITDDGFAKYRIYRSYTKDFITFSAPELYIEEANATIDTTIIDYKGIYYRFTKDESHSAVTMMKCNSLNGDWKNVDTYNLGTMTGYEGPTIYKLNGENRWCLLLDYFSKSQGYKPFVTEDITEGVFSAASDFNFDGTYRHGTVMPITAAEYSALVSAVWE